MYKDIPRTEGMTIEVLKNSPLGAQMFSKASSLTQYLAIELSYVWHEFSMQLKNTEFIRAIESGSVTLEQYRAFL